MFSQLFVAVYLALFTAATPLTVRKNSVTVSLARRINVIGSKTFVELDKARAKSLMRSATQKGHKLASSGAGVSFPATNVAATTYFATVQVGYPPTPFSLIVDTGSSNTWVGADPSNPYIPTSTSYDTGEPMSQTYGSGGVNGTEFIDQVSLAEGLTIAQSIGVANASIGFNGTDGILGIGPTDLTAGSLSHTSILTACLYGTGSVGNGGPVPTVLDNAFAQGLIDEKLLSVSFEPTNNVSETNGEITFGDIDRSKFIGDIHFVDMTTTSPSSNFYGVNQTVHYGSTPILNNNAGVIDTGTTLLLLATEAFDAYQQLTGAVMDENLGLLSITPEQLENLQSLYLNVGG
ncbi:uncharacterized protein PHACADRAFT_80588, partial [Phanerochaete carnosa HHB-10118-sp]